MDSIILKQSFIGIGNKKEGFSPSDHKREKYELLNLPACVMCRPPLCARCGGLLQPRAQTAAGAASGDQLPGNVTTSGGGDCLLPSI